MADPAYESAVQDTFARRPLRTVLMIDDEFPTFSDLGVGETDTNKNHFKQKDRALALYNSFQKNEMLCDIENSVSDSQTNKLRKSDLIVLDYHLGPGDRNSEKSISILRDLASSDHFNTVVVYTAETDLNQVWLDIIASLSGGWTSLPAELEGEAQAHWERLSANNQLPTVTLESTLEFAKQGNLRDLSTNNRSFIQNELVELGVEPKNCGKIIEALLCTEMARRSEPYATEPKREAVGGFESEKFWIQCRNAFITILTKTDLTESETDPAGILSALNAALLAWKPNFIQILTSEIQNILELEALISEDKQFREPLTHASLSYYLLNSLGPIDPATTPDVRVPITNLIDKIIEGVRRRLSTDPNLLELATNALLGELRNLDWNLTNWPDGTNMIKASTNFSRTSEMVKAPDIFLRLNSFLSTETFRRAHVTTGTIIHHSESNTYFVIASPSCDLVPRQPSPEQKWTRLIHPLTPIITISLNQVQMDSALAEAAHGRHIFLETETDKFAFLTVASSGQPSYELLMVEDGGLVKDVAGTKVFTAGRIVPKNTTETDTTTDNTSFEWIYSEFSVVGQLRGVNANRLLQLAGQHLSRIGMDYIDLPT